MKRRDESGFALLLVFMMAASIAIMLYMQLPRAAFEAQRDKEQLLQDRGEQYIRGIQLYVAKWRSYPSSLDTLEKTNNIRYLRRRYKDPMTGKDEWRPIHVNAAGQLIDSIVQKKKEEKKDTGPVFVSELPTVGSTTGTTGDAAQNVALRRRPSDAPAAPGTQGNAGSAVDFQALGTGAQIAPSTNVPTWNPQGQPITDPNNPNAGQPPSTPLPPGFPQPNATPGQAPPFPQQNPQQPSQQQPFQQQPGAPGFPPFPTSGSQNMGNGFNPASPASPVNAAGTQTGIQGGMQGGMQGGTQAAGQPTGANSGLDMIKNLLTTPRSGMNMAVPGANGLQIGGGIAGFASKYEAPSIKIYNERQKYNEWEFVYDMKKDKRLVGAAAATGGVPANNNPLGGQSPNSPAIPNPLTNTSPTNPPANNNNPFGPQTPNYPQPGRR